MFGVHLPELATEIVANHVAKYFHHLAVGDCPLLYQPLKNCAPAVGKPILRRQICGVCFHDSPLGNPAQTKTSSSVGLLLSRDSVADEIECPTTFDSPGLFNQQFGV